MVDYLPIRITSDYSAQVDRKLHLAPPSLVEIICTHLKQAF